MISKEDKSMKKFESPKLDIYKLAQCDIVTLSEGTLIDPDTEEPETPIITE